MIKDEKPILSKLAPEIQEAIPLVVEHVLKIDEIRQIHKRDQEKQSETKKKRKRTFNTSFACIGTSSEKMAMLALNKEESEVRKMKVEALRAVMSEKMEFQTSSLKRGNKWKTRVELLEMVESYYASKVTELNHIIEATLKKELKQFPPLTPCRATQTLEDATASHDC